MDILAVILFGLAGGAVGGLLGVGGGVLFVPAVAIFLDEPLIRAEATSLLAIVPVAIVGTWRQHRHGNVRLGDGAVLAAVSVPGIVVGVVVANAVPPRALELGFAALLIFVAGQLVRRALATAPGAEEPAGG
jgi:uncharacterized protein